MKDLSIVIVNFNTRDYLRNCLQSLEKNTSKKLDYEIVVVDNASADGSAEMVKKEFPDVTLIASKENTGFAKGNNLGIKRTSQSRYVLFLNPDTIVKDDTIENMIAFMESHPDAGAATCKLVTPDGKEDESTHRGFPTPWNSLTHFSGLSKAFPKSHLFSRYTMGWLDLSKTMQVDALEGAFMLVPRKAGEEVGWWDEEYFFYGEDLEFCLQLRKRGYKIYYVPMFTVEHVRGVSAGIKKGSENLSPATREIKIRATKERFRAMRLFYKKHYEKEYPKFVKWLVFAGINYKEKKAMKSL